MGFYVQRVECYAYEKEERSPLAEFLLVRWESSEVMLNARSVRAVLKINDTCHVRLLQLILEHIEQRARRDSGLLVIDDFLPSGLNTYEK